MIDKMCRQGIPEKRQYDVSTFLEFITVVDDSQSQTGACKR